MKYMLLLRHEPEQGPAEGTPELAEEMRAWGELTAELVESGVLVTAMGLDTEDAATTLRLRDGERIVTDGPFAETKERLFSYFVIDVADLDDALAWAARMPNAAYGSVEVRPLSVRSQGA